jgi:hypothetical protein
MMYWSGLVRLGLFTSSGIDLVDFIFTAVNHPQELAIPGQTQPPIPGRAGRTLSIAPNDSIASSTANSNTTGP